MLKRLATSLFILLLFVQIPAAWASELSRFNAAVNEAYTHTRGALFYLHTGNPAVAEFELEAAIESWQTKVMSFRDAPPDAYADDGIWDATLDDIARRLEQARGMAQAGDTERAEALLQPVRPALAALRARNSQRSFSDCIDEANAAMDELWVYRNEPPDFADGAAVNDLKAKTAVTAYLYRRCQAEAPPEIAEAPEFLRIMGGTIASLDRLWPAIDAGNAEVVISILREVRSFDRMLWLQFG